VFYLSWLEIEKTVKTLYIVRMHDLIRSSDHNTLVDYVKALRDFLYMKYRLEVDFKELDEVLAKLRHVKSGDVVLYTDHNYLVEACRIIRNIIWDRLVPSCFPSETISTTDTFSYELVEKSQGESHG